MNIASVSGTTDATMQSSGWATVPQMSMNYTPTNSQVYVSYSASGFGWTNSMSLVEFRVLVNGSVQGGCMEKVGVWTDDFLTTYSVTTWSANFERLVNVSAGSNTSFTVQYRVSAIDGTAGVVINPQTTNANHRTLTVMDGF